MVEVFKTNITEIEHAEILTFKIQQQFPTLKINFDLEDCDNILRVEGSFIPTNEIINLLHLEDYYCETLF